MAIIALVRPDPKDIGVNLEAYFPGHVPARRLPGTPAAPFSARDLLRDAPMRLANVANCAAQGNMAIVMVLTSLVLSHHGHSLTAIAVSHMLHSMGMFAFTVPLGKLADRFGREPLMYPGVATTLVGALLVTYGESFFSITLGTFLVGVGWAAANVAATALVADRYKSTERGRAIGVADSFAGATAVLAALVTGPLIDWSGLPAAGLAAVLIAAVPLAMRAADADSSREPEWMRDCRGLHQQRQAMQDSVTMRWEGEDTMLELYHSGLTTCSKQVRHCLREKGLAYESRYVELWRYENLSPAYLALNPNGVVPTLVHDGTPIVNSFCINEYIEDAFPDPPLRPSDLEERARMRHWAWTADEIHLSLARLTHSRMLQAARAGPERGGPGDHARAHAGPGEARALAAPHHGRLFGRTARHRAGERAVHLRPHAGGDRPARAVARRRDLLARRHQHARRSCTASSSSTRPASSAPRSRCSTTGGTGRWRARPRSTSTPTEPRRRRRARRRNRSPGSARTASRADPVDAPPADRRRSCADDLD